MAKDAKGHGSEKRGGGGRMFGKNEVMIDSQGRPTHSDISARLAAARNDPNHPLGALTNAVSGAVARGTATPIAGQDAKAASELAGGHPKSGAAPVHGGMGSGSWGRNPSNPTNEYNRDLALRVRDKQVGSGMKHRG